MRYSPNLDIEKLLQYGLLEGLIENSDVIPVRNALFHKLGVEYLELLIDEPRVREGLHNIMDRILDYCFYSGILKQNTTTYRDLLDSELMGLFTPRQSEIISNFYRDRDKSGTRFALSKFYKLCRASNYIRVDRIDKNRSWKCFTEYGDLEITINLSKPEKDPVAIAAATTLPQSSYPKCMLCKENVGFYGRVNHPARQNHRVLPFKLNGENWSFQYSPYLYYNEHSIVFCDEHRPMKISKDTFKRLLSFVKQVPDYFIGSNADLPIVGGSILSHDHFQSGCYSFPMESAEEILNFSSERFKGVNISILKWPLSVIRIKGNSYEDLVELADNIFRKWKVYWDPARSIMPISGDIFHNTITPIARFRDEKYELDLVLRNNRTDKERPDGIFHPGKELHHIKKENIGLIEVMGLAILPGRLAKELRIIKELLMGLLSIEEVKKIEELDKHWPWIDDILSRILIPLKSEDAEIFLQNEVGNKYKSVLEDAGVFKQSEDGFNGFKNFMLNSGFKLHTTPCSM